ncbi:putative RNA-binding protein [Hamiltosporidium tvaerminnensis]|uniref:Putative RNA-binding protein n=2 Tax=Hamiltosporidium TaxID=1176354 RepID=A0A4V2JTS2_9MICR|nr:putative RNA-binding protein [Hamiltosporidium magnivora]TBT99038.1 putative RNA-binding protein [Hamiltosporidium tvaerminnensis]TBU07352.1 putative RNA-binding protein [Hamiltosporidium magnivora]
MIFRAHISNLHKSCTQETLLKEFKGYSNILEIKVPKNKYGYNKGYAFIDFSSSVEYLRFIKENNGTFINGKPIKIRKSKNSPLNENMVIYKK